MRVVADSHALYFYLFSPDRLSERALEVLGQSEDSDGIVASVVSLADLWYVDNWSFALDVKILLMTLGKAVRRSDVILGQDVKDVDDLGLSA